MNCKKRKNVLTSQLREEFPFIVPNAGDCNVKCLRCCATFSIAHGGSADIYKHVSSPRHLRSSVPGIDIDDCDGITKNLKHLSKVSTDKTEVPSTKPEESRSLVPPMVKQTPPVNMKQYAANTAATKSSLVKSVSPPKKNPSPNVMPALKQDPPPLAPRSSADADSMDEVCLRWNSHHSNMQTSFPELLKKEQYVDVTLCADNQMLRCHRLILSSCSAYFEEILQGIAPFQHPVIFLKGIQFWILKALIDFMYVGEVHIEQTKLQDILEAAETLKVKGLTGKKVNSKEEPKPQKPPQLVQQKPVKVMPPLRLAVPKDQLNSKPMLNPLALFQTGNLENNTNQNHAPGINYRIPFSINDSTKQQQSSQSHSWQSRKIPPKKKLKRKSSPEHERDVSPPPILRKGTKSRPIVKAPKYYHNEFEENKTPMKLEDSERDDFKIESVPSPPHPQLDKEVDSPPPPRLDIDPFGIFDISAVKAEPADVLDIEENDVNFEPTGTIKFGDNEDDDMNADVNTITEQSTIQSKELDQREKPAQFSAFNKQAQYEISENKNAGSKEDFEKT